MMFMEFLKVLSMGFSIGFLVGGIIGFIVGEYKEE